MQHAYKVHGFVPSKTTIKWSALISNILCQSTELKKSPLKWGGNFYSDATDRERGKGTEKREVGRSPNQMEPSPSPSVCAFLHLPPNVNIKGTFVTTYRGRKHMLRCANLIHCKPDVKYSFSQRKSTLIQFYLMSKQKLLYRSLLELLNRYFVSDFTLYARKLLYKPFLVYCEKVEETSRVQELKMEFHQGGVIWSRNLLLMSWFSLNLGLGLLMSHFREQGRQISKSGIRSRSAIRKDFK